MAESIVGRIIVEDLLVEAAPELENGPDTEVDALAALLQPALDLVVSAYRQVSMQPSTEIAFRRFMERMAQAGD
jgi:hypothetical protein